MNTVYVSVVHTEGGDEHTFATWYCPTDEWLAKAIWEIEGKEEDLEWYLNTLSYNSYALEVEEGR